MADYDKIAELKQDWAETGLHRKEMDQQPMRQFEFWYQQAIDSGIAEPNAMCLATTSRDAAPSQRTVLMKMVDMDGLIFYTNYGSRKARQIAENDKVSVIFPWIALHRQVIFEGAVEKISSAESLRYFMTRERGSQLGAWTSQQSEVIKSRSLLKSKLAQIRQKFSGGEIPLPDFWGGYRVRPVRVEFWQGRVHRLHDRFLYTRDSKNSWKIERLSP